MHSWRTMILPYTEQSKRYEQYALNEPWDSPKNQQLQLPVPPYLECPEDKAGFERETSYVAVCGAGASWTNENALNLSHFLKGTSRTVLVIETHHAGIPWMEPRDITVDEAVRELSDPDVGGRGGHRRSGFFFDYGISGHRMLMADGSVVFIPTLSEEAARDLLSGNYSDVDHLASHAEFRRLRYDNIFRLTMFIALALLPSYWVVVRIRRERAVA